MWTWGWLPTVRFAASQWRQRIFIVARNIRSGSGPTANRGSILMCIYLVFRTFLYYVTMISSAWLMELWALPYPFGPTVVQPKARLVRAASSVETSHHCDLFWNILIQVPSLSFICCADHGSVDFNVNIIEIDLFRHLFRCCNVLQSRALWCAGSDPGASIDSSTHRLIDSASQLELIRLIRFVDKAFVIRALHLRAPSATALLEETLQCSKCVCTRTVCVRNVNFTV